MLLTLQATGEIIEDVELNLKHLFIMGLKRCTNKLLILTMNIIKILISEKMEEIRK